MDFDGFCGQRGARRLVDSLVRLEHLGLPNLDSQAPGAGRAGRSLKGLLADPGEQGEPQALGKGPKEQESSERNGERENAH